MRENYVLKNANILPMDGEYVLEKRDVFIKDGIIERIVESGTTEFQAEVIDCTGKYVLPGLHDCHVHIGCADDMITLLCYGITTAVNLMGTPAHLKWRDAVKANQMMGCDLFTSGPICDKTSQYLDFMDVATNQTQTLGDSLYPAVLYREGIALVTDDESARNAVRYTKAAGYDFVKLYNSISQEVYEAVADEATQLGIKIFGHMPDFLNSEYVNSTEPIRQQSVEHLSSVNINDAVRIAQAGCCIDPTLAVEFVFFDGGLQNEAYQQHLTTVNPLQLERWAHSKERHMAAYKDKAPGKKVIRRGFDYYAQVVKTFREHGGKILLGTDGCLELLLPGYTTHLELQLLVRCSMTAYEALYAATVEPAKFLGTIDCEGTVEIGKRAKLLILDKNPLDDISNTQGIYAVIKDRLFIDKQQIQQLRDESSRKNSAELEFI